MDSEEPQVEGTREVNLACVPLTLCINSKAYENEQHYCLEALPAHLHVYAATIFLVLWLCLRRNYLVT
jgi:hypothetical protein